MPSDNDQKNKTAIFAIFSIIAIFLGVSCKECPTEPDYDIFLSIEDVFCTSVVLKVTLPDSGSINTFALERNDSTIAAFTCIDDDTLITDENLVPDTDYLYSVRFLKDGKTKAKSETVTVHTMPTTSHDFIWEIDTLGNYGSYLNDAWIVNEDDIWVIGYIRVDDPDSSFAGTGWESFNAAHWDGEEWELMRIINSAPLLSIWYFSENDIWANSSYPQHWDGEKWTLYRLDQSIRPGIISACWGTSSSNIYFVGNEGTIVHYNGSRFTKMNSGTNIDLEDVYGIGSHVFAVGSNTDGEYSGQSIALYGNEGNWETISHEYAFYPQNSSDRGKICSVWAYDRYIYYIDFSGLMRYNPANGDLDEWFSINEMNTYHLNIIKIRGNALNDIIHVNNWVHIVHYNGQDWLPIEDVFNQYPDGEIDVEGMDFKNDIVAIVGFTRYYSHAAIIRGYRN